MARSQHSPESVVETLQAVGRSGDADLQEAVDLVASLCGAAYAGVSVIEDGLYHLVLTHGLPRLSCAPEESICEPAGPVEQVVVVEDLSADARFHHNPWVDGSRMSLRFYAAAPVRSPEGEVVGRLCVFDDQPRSLSALQKRALEALAASATGLLELQFRRSHDLPSSTAEDEMARIAAEISHDMRAPLASIVANVELLRDGIEGEGDPTVDIMLRRTDRAASRLLHMVEGLMKFHQAGYLTNSTDVDLAELLEQVVIELQGSLDEAGATLRIHQLPVVAGDPDQLHSVLLNLLSNAVKYRRPEVPPFISVSSSTVGDHVRISVTDNGGGVPPGREEEVFAMFGRANARVEGHGIGLATVRRIARAHGGDAGLVSDGKTGTEAWFELPVDPPVPLQRTVRSARVVAQS